MTLNPLLELYRQALSEPMTSFIFCGGSAQVFLNHLSELTLLATQEYTLVLVSDTVDFEENSPGLRVVRDPSMDGGTFIRSALRQDPDTLILDSRAVTNIALLVQAKLTGHRVVFHHPKPIEEAFLECRAESGRDGDFLADAFLDRVFFISLVGDEVAGVQQAQKGPTAPLSLVPVLERSGSDWNRSGAVSNYQPPTPTMACDEAMQVPDDWPESGDGMLKELVAHLGGHRRVAWAPIMGRSGESSGFGQFGGVPRLGPQEVWPCCQGCEEPMTLVLEIDLDKAPEPFQAKVGSEGLFQFFYCTKDGCSVDSPWEPFQGNNLARQLVGCHHRTSESSATNYDAAPIMGWVAMQEGANWEERPRLGIARDFLENNLFQAFTNMAEYWYDPDKLERYYGPIRDYFRLDPESTQDLFTHVNTLPGDKLLGWPSWTQGVEYPKCRHCESEMEMLVQINNDGYAEAPVGQSSALGQLFAADGNGHIFRCPKDGTLTFGWACG